MHTVLAHQGTLWHGFLLTLELTVLGYVGALVLGTVAAICRVSPVAPLRVFGGVYVEAFRNVPLLALLLLFVFGLPDVGLTVSYFKSAAICLALSAGAFVCEAMRSGINSIGLGQAEAARAIGLSFSQSLRHVVLPQAFRSMVQPLVNVFIGVALGSALAAAVGVDELTRQTQFLNLQYAVGAPSFLAAGVLYFALAVGGGAVGGYLERRVKVHR